MPTFIELVNIRVRTGAQTPESCSTDLVMLLYGNQNIIILTKNIKVFLNTFLYTVVKLVQ